MSQNGSTSEQMACACGCKKSVKPGQRWYEPACKARKYRRGMQANHEATDYRVYELEEALEEVESDRFELRRRLEALEQVYIRLKEEHRGCEVSQIEAVRNAYRLMRTSAPTSNAFAILGVRYDAEPEAIEGAYKALAKKYHPDRHPGNPEMERRMKALNAAYTEVMRQRGYR